MACVAAHRTCDAAKVLIGEVEVTQAGLDLLSRMQDICERR
jgi:hypothetical protein